MKRRPSRTSVAASGRPKRRCRSPPLADSDEDPGAAVADDEPGAGEPVDGDDFDSARQSSRGPAEHGGGEDAGADRQTDYLGGANVAADDVDGEADDRVSHEHPRDHARDDAEDEAPVDAGGRDRADHQAL